MIQNPRVFIFLGSGGVGKTTVAAAVGLSLAKAGFKVLVLTIDPSQRLKTTLDLPVTGEIKLVSKMTHNQGSLSGAVVNPNKVFRDFLKAISHDEVRAEKIVNNKLFQQLISNLSGSQEFTALQCLWSHFDQKKFDFILLDTPPAQHAVEFLKAPEKLAELFSKKITRWFIRGSADESFLWGLFHSGTSKTLKLMEALTGSEFMKELSEFFQNIAVWQEQIEERISLFQQVLEKSEFVLITGVDPIKMKECQSLIQDLKIARLSLTKIVINRFSPVWWNDSIALELLGSHEVAPFYHEVIQYYSERQKYVNDFSGAHSKLVKVLLLPEMNTDISDLNGLELLLPSLEGQIL